MLDRIPSFVDYVKQTISHLEQSERPVFPSSVLILDIFIFLPAKQRTNFNQEMVEDSS